jgi:hypothetical protein
MYIRWNMGCEVQKIIETIMGYFRKAGTRPAVQIISISWRRWEMLKA